MKKFFILLMILFSTQLFAVDVTQSNKVQCEFNSAVAPDIVAPADFTSLLTSMTVGMKDPVPIDLVYSIRSWDKQDESLNANFAVMQNQNFDRMYRF